jgi:hypothetical protein
MPTTRRNTLSAGTSPAKASPVVGRRSTRKKLLKEEDVRRGNNDEGMEADMSSDEEEEDQQDSMTYVLDGVQYETYSDFVAAKRKRNEEKLQKLGFLDDSTNFMSQKKQKTTPTAATQRGIKRNKTNRNTLANLPARKSSRLSGTKTQLVALDYYVNDWNRNNSTVINQGGDDVSASTADGETKEKVSFFKGRVNDGSDLSLHDAIQLNESKWIRDNSELLARQLLDQLKSNATSPQKPGKANTNSPTSVLSTDEDTAVQEQIQSMVAGLAIDDEELVAKTTPDRIYSVVTHPSESKLICCAGDKQGYIGLWDVDAVSTPGDDNNNGVNLFRPHSRPVCCLEWLNNDNMM